MTATLQTASRARLGTRPSRYLRLQGRIPVSLHGEGKEQLHLSIDNREFLTARRRHEHVFSLELEGGGNDTAMVRELQWDPLGESIVHVEFRRVDLTRETEAEVELEFVGHPKGGILNHLVTHLTVAAVPSEIPDSIEINVDDLEVGHPLLAAGVKLPDGVRMVTPGEVSVAVVAVVKEEAAPEGEEASGEATPVPEADKGKEDKGKEDKGKEDKGKDGKDGKG